MTVQSIFPNGAPLPLLLGVAAVFAYFCGCFNGAVIVSKYILRDDVRTHGSGNAGLTNFHRTFGGPLTLVVILLDVVKAVAAVLVVFDSRVGGLGWRYSADFGWLISLASIPGLLWLVNGREPSRSLAGANDAASGDGIARVTPWRWLMRWVVMLAVLWALGIAILSCFVQSRSDSMIANNPTLWHQVQSWFTLL